MNRRNVISGLLVLAAISWSGGWVVADDLETLQKRFKERYEKLLALKQQGQVGETWEGFVGTVTNSAPAESMKLVDDENSDRRKLYALIAEKEGTTVETVASRNAARNFEKAKSGEYLKGKDGTWKKKT